MKCMFHVEDRHEICLVLSAADKPSFRSRLLAALKLDELADSEAEAGIVHKWTPSCHHVIHHYQTKSVSRQNLH